MYTDRSRPSRVNGLGDPPAAPAPRALRQILCSAAQLGTVTSILVKPSSAAEIQAAVQQAAAGALSLARAGTASTAGQGAALFEAVFGVPPAWHPAGATWMLGGVVRKRMMLAAKLLSSGSVSISCFGWPWPDPHPDTPDAYIVRAIGGKYRIGLGRTFWKAVRDGDTESAEAALLAAALRIYFGELIRFATGGKSKNQAHCYLRYALHLARRTIPLWIGDGCPIPPARWNRLMPAAAGQPVSPTPSQTPVPAKPVRLRLTDEELERILRRKLTDPLSDHINWVISQVPPTGIARPTLGEQLKKKLREGVDDVSSRLGVPQKYRKYVQQVAEGAVKKGSKLVVEEGLKRIGVGSEEAIEAVWGVVERTAKESP